MPWSWLFVQLYGMFLVPSLTCFLLLPCKSYLGTYTCCTARLGGRNPLPQAAAASMRGRLVNRTKLRIFFFDETCC